MKRILGRLALLCTVLGLACALLVGTALAENTLTLPADLTTIEAEAFEGLQSVDRIDLPGSVMAIGAGAFRNCGKPTAEPRYYFPPVGVSVGAGPLMAAASPSSWTVWSCPA